MGSHACPKYGHRWEHRLVDDMGVRLEGKTCVYCGKVEWLTPRPPPLRDPAVAACDYKSLRAAWHARSWK